jgi:hypothetical protein
MNRTASSPVAPNVFIDGLGRPAPQGGFAMADYWVWGGSVIWGEDGAYHMYVSRWPKKYPFYEGYVVSSEIVHATSETPDGRFAFQQVILPDRGEQFWDGRMTHNPTIHRHGERYLLFYLGVTFKGPRPDPKVLWENPGRTNHIGYAGHIGLATATSPWGPWERLDEPILSPRPDHWDHSVTTNPAPCVHEGGSILLIYRSYGLQHGVAFAERWDKPFRRLGEGPISCFTGPARIEDPYLWHDGKRYHLIAKDLSEDGALSGEVNAGVSALSEDGIHWRWDDPLKAYSRRLTWSDGKTTVQGCLERPQVLVENGRLRCLYAATGDGPGGFARCTRTWNVAIPVGQIEPHPETG